MGGASKYLADLPSRGLFSSSTILSSNLGVMRVYVCDHDTTPPEEQLIKTNATNILIRSLQLNKDKNEARDAKHKAANGNSRSKRLAEKPIDGKTPAKRINRTNDLEGSSTFPSDRDLQTCTVEQLRALLKEKGLTTRGKKDELISRLREGDSLNHS